MESHSMKNILVGCGFIVIVLIDSKDDITRGLFVGGTKMRQSPWSTEASVNCIIVNFGHTHQACVSYI